MHFKRVGITLAVLAILVLSCFPVAAGNMNVSAGDADTDSGNKTDEEISVWFTVTRMHDILLPPTQVPVTNFDPAEYGFGHLGMSPSINGGHVWIQAQADEFGTENLQSVMSVRSDGFLLEFWNFTDGADGAYIMYTINNTAVNKCANWIPMNEGDIFNLFFLDYTGGMKPRSFDTYKQTVLTGDDVTVSVSGSSADPNESKDDSPIYLYKDGVSDDLLGHTDNNGRFTYSFDEPGTYWLYSYKESTAIGWTQVIVRDVFAQNVEVDMDEASIAVNGTVDLTATVTPSNADETGLQWSSSQKSVASVSKDGTVTGISPGRSIITAKTLDGDHVASCEVTVKYDNTGGGSDGGSDIILYAGVGAIGILAAAAVVFFYIRR